MRKSSAAMGPRQDIEGFGIKVAMLQETENMSAKDFGGAVCGADGPNVAIVIHLNVVRHVRWRKVAARWCMVQLGDMILLSLYLPHWWGPDCLDFYSTF